MKTASLFSLLLLLALSPLARADLQVLGLFDGAALVKVDGEQKLLKVGREWKGVTLVEANSRQAIATINGERQVLTLSTHISTNYAKSAAKSVRIPKNRNRQYITNAEINGRRLPVLVDTGANIIAMNAATARSLGVDFSRGVPSQVKTASGVVTAHSVMLASVDVGGIRVDRVQASVLEGAQPDMVLLGMSFLQHVTIQEQNGVMLLTAKF